MRHHWRYKIKWAFIHVALVAFFADLVAAVWPDFEKVWNTHVAHLGVAIAAFLATLSEYIHDEEK